MSKKAPPSKKRPPPFGMQMGGRPVEQLGAAPASVALAVAACGVVHESAGDDLPTCPVCRPLAQHALRISLQEGAP